MLPFSGPARPLKPSDLVYAAAELGCDVAAVKAVLTVETGAGGGFLGDESGRPRILFEAHLFSEATGHRFDSAYPDISSPVQNWQLYRGGAGEYVRLGQAVALDRDAGLRSTSWGLFQILASNREICGYSSADSFVAAMAQGESEQLGAFVAFVRGNGYAGLLAAHEWAAFARRYNGPDYAVNRYDQRLAAAYELAVGGSDFILRMGCTGPRVMALQEALGRVGFACPVDGQFGPLTELAVMHFQDQRHLGIDGIAGTETMTALGLKP